MVASNLHPAIVYKEDKKVEDEDLQFDSSLYDITIKSLKLNITIALGKQKLHHSNKNVIYFPIYLIHNDDVIMKIGIFEIEDNKIQYILDEDDEADISKIKVAPLFFEFATRDKLERYANKVLDEDDINNEVTEDDGKEDENNEGNDDNDDDDDEDEDDDDDEDEDDDGDKDSDNIIMEEDETIGEDNETINKNLEEYLFEKKVNFTEKKLEKEEEHDAQKEKDNYVEKLKSTWIEKFMHNNNYDISDVDPDGHCFFYVLRDAFLGVGKTTTIQKLRKVLSENVSENTYNNYKENYTMFQNSIKNDTEEINKLKDEVKKLKKECKQSNEPKLQKSCGEKIEEKVELMEKLLEEKQVSEDMLEEYNFMKNINTFEKFKKVLQTCKFWADTIAISTLERVMNVKVIILSSEAYEQEDKDNVIHCGQLNDDILQKKGTFTPDYYIIADYTGNHYKLITYKNKEIFSFDELPHDLKKLILIKCLERDSGPYSIIKDFKNMKEKIKGKEVKNEIDVEIIETESKDYVNDTVFQIYGKSNDKPLPGKGNGEKIDEDNLLSYSGLAKHLNWRRKLSNMYVSPFMLKGKNWNSVEHYYQAHKYLHDDSVFEQFTLDSKSSISEDPNKAKEAGQKPSYFSKKLKMDSNFDKNASKYLMEGLEAKFTQNEDFKKILMDTKNAKITHYHRANEPVVLKEMMELRTKLK